MPTVRMIETDVADSWLASGAISITDIGEENTYYTNEFGHQFYCKNYPENREAIAWVTWKPGMVYWVAQVKGDGGVDWGYTTSSAEAIKLSPYWQARFKADQRYCGREAQFLTV